MKKTLLLMAFSIMLYQAGDVGATVITLDQAIARAMDSNRDIGKAKEYANLVQGKYVEERAAALPQLSLNGSISMAKDESQQVSGAVAQRQTARFADLTLTQPLFTWGKLNAALRAAEVGLKTADEQLRIYRQAVYRDVVAAYLDAQLANELAGIAKENRAQKLKHLDESKRKFAAGVATDYDVLAAEVSADNAMPEVIRTENNSRITVERLRFLIAAGNEQIEVSSSLESLENLRLPAGLEEGLQLAVKRRPELSDLRLRIGIYNELVVIAAAENKPRFDLKAAAGWHWLGLDSPSPAHSSDGPAWSAGVYLSFPFFDGLRTSGKVAQARSEMHSREIEAERLRDQILLEVRQAESVYLEATEILKAVTGTVSQAARLVGMAEKGYEYGVKIRLEVEDAQLNLMQAKSSLARAKRDLTVARAGYLWAVGIAGEQ